MSPARSGTSTAARSPVTRPAGPVAERRRRLAQFPTGVEGELGEYVAPTRGSTQPAECRQQDDRVDRCPASPAASRVGRSDLWRQLLIKRGVRPNPSSSPARTGRPCAGPDLQHEKQRGAFGPWSRRGRTGRSDRAPERRRRRFHERGIGDPALCAVKTAGVEDSKAPASRASRGTATAARTSQ